MKTTICLCVLLSAATVHAMPVHSAVGDFNKTANAAGQRWTYRYSTDKNRDGSYLLLPNFSPNTTVFAPDFSVWSTGGVGTGNITPGVGVNDTGGTSTFVGNANAFPLPNDSVFMHPGPAGFAVITWLSPVAAVVRVDLSVIDADTNGGDGQNWYLDRNGTPVAGAQGLVDHSNAFAGQFNVAVTPGDQLHLIIDPRLNYFFDSTAVQFDVTLPEPGALALLGVGGAAALLRRR